MRLLPAREGEDADGNEKLKREKSDTEKLVVCGEAANGKITWHQEGFLRPSGDDMDCRIYIRRGGQLRGPKLLTIPVPDGSGDIRIGLEKVSDNLVRICIGESNLNSYTSSDIINVLTD